MKRIVLTTTITLFAGLCFIALAFFVFNPLNEDCEKKEFDDHGNLTFHGFGGDCKENFGHALIFKYEYDEAGKMVFSRFESQSNGQTTYSACSTISYDETGLKTSRSDENCDGTVELCYIERSSPKGTCTRIDSGCDGTVESYGVCSKSAFGMECADGIGDIDCSNWDADE